LYRIGGRNVPGIVLTEWGIRRWGGSKLSKAEAGRSAARRKEDGLQSVVVAVARCHIDFPYISTFPRGKNTSRRPMAITIILETEQSQ